MISLRCSKCGGVLEVDEDREMIFCPYCGEKSLVEVTDKVRIEKIHADKEIKLEQMKNEENEKESKRDIKEFLIWFGAILLLWILFEVF